MRSRWIVLACAWIAAGPAAFSQPATETGSAAARYEFREQHDRNGLGKFYLGREIALVMGHEAANWLERTNRDAEEKSELLVRTLPILPGQVVADIGAGTGYFSRRLAKKVGPSGKILAVDIQPEMLKLLVEQAAAAGVSNVVPVLGTISDPKLPAASVDWILMVDVYHEFSHPFEMTEAMCRALKPGGRVVFVEFRAEDPTVPIKNVHKMSEAQVKKEMAPHPLEWAETIGVLPWQHIIIFRKRGN